MNRPGLVPVHSFALLPGYRKPNYQFPKFLEYLVRTHGLDVTFPGASQCPGCIRR